MRDGAEEPGTSLFLEAVRVAVDVHRGGMVQQPVQDGAGDDGVPKDLPPGPEALVAGEQDGSPFVAPTDPLEEEVGPLPVDGDGADLIADQERGLGMEGAHATPSSTSAAYTPRSRTVTSALVG